MASQLFMQSDIKGKDGNAGDEAGKLMHNQTLKAMLEILEMRPVNYCTIRQ